MINKSEVKRLLGDVPLTAEAYWLLRQRGRPLSKSFSLHRIEEALPEWLSQAGSCRAQFAEQSNNPRQRRVLIFSTLRYWIEHSLLLGIALAGMGHDVTFTYLPYANWQKQLNRFDLRRQNAYARKVLNRASPLLKPISLLDIKWVDPVNGKSFTLPDGLEESIQEVSLRDTQYTLQIEDIEKDNSESQSAQLYRLRLERNKHAAYTVYTWLKALDMDQRPNLIITPNGSILEMGAVYQVARYLGIPTTTYEFGEQRGRIWCTQNGEVMRQETGELWAAYKDKPFDEVQYKKMGLLYASRQSASLWKNFSRLWQDQPSQGGEQTRKILGLDRRPIVLLAANVIGDSLTLGRQVFSRNMTEWLEHTIQTFANRHDVQFLIRVHPGERYTQGPSVAELVRQTLPKLPDHIHLIEAKEPVNTYDLVEIADLGLVYTTTVGMEMAMSGLPVIVAGQTHYRKKGFTLDPSSWEEYDGLLEQIVVSPNEHRLTHEQVERAWHYAYCFFFRFPFSFPWHLLYFWDELETWSIERVLSNEGQSEFGNIFRYLVGEPRDWKTPPSTDLNDTLNQTAFMRHTPERL